jgi:uncharacterized heparinase superfamily protein
MWETIRHLRFRQIYHQVSRRILPRRKVHALPMHWRTLRLRVLQQQTNLGHRTCFNGKDRFRFNQDERVFTGDWNETGARKLWLYNLHYMAWLFDAPEQAQAWMLRWIRENPRERRGNGWEPYPISLRIFHWCKYFAMTDERPSESTRVILDSLALQTAHLLGDMEYHLDGNHLLENALALVAIGFHIDANTEAGRKTLNQITRLARQCLEDQFLNDGGHYELSPMYHSILLGRILDLLNMWPEAQDPYPGLQELLCNIALRALDWLAVMTVDSRFALFNDSCYDAAPEPYSLFACGQKLLGWARKSPGELQVLKASGFSRVNLGAVTLIFDCGPLGPDHQMGHAQGDMLSVCLWLRERPVFVHPGNYEYLPGTMRDYCRSTAAHNTLVFEGCEQADWWASHRVGWRGRMLDVMAEWNESHGNETTGKVRLQGAHNGYSRLPGHPIHRRVIEGDASSIEIIDSLSSRPDHPVRVYFHLHPDCLTFCEGNSIRIEIPQGTLKIETDQPYRFEDSWYCPEFGLKIANRALVLDLKDKECRTLITPIT